MAKQIIRSIRKGSVQWNEEDRLQMVSMLAKAGYAVQIVRKEIPSSETRKTTQYEYVIEYGVMKVMKPIFRTKQYIKYGFVKMEHEYYCCPKCRNILNAGPNYQPEFCDRCGQALDFSNTEWKEDRQIGFVEPEAV